MAKPRRKIVKKKKRVKVPYFGSINSISLSENIKNIIYCNQQVGVAKLKENECNLWKFDSSGWNAAHYAVMSMLHKIFNIISR